MTRTDEFQKKKESDELFRANQLTAQGVKKLRNKESIQIHQ